MSIVDALSRVNRWWRTGRVAEGFLHPTARVELGEILAALPQNRILAIIGPRRVGKSTLLLQAVDHLLKTGTNPKHILFFGGDDPALFAKGVQIGDVMEAYAVEVLGEALEELSHGIFVFIDEIHFVKDWQLWLKRYYDQKILVKFIVSGSSSAYLFHESKESLMGRIDYLRVMPLSLRGFSAFYAASRTRPDITDFYARIPAFSFFTNPEAYYEAIRESSWKLEPYRPAVMQMIQEYHFAGGYPEFFESANRIQWQKRLLDDIIAQGLYRDVVSIHSIKTPELLEKLVYFIAANNGQAFAYATLAQTLGVDTETVSTYLSYLSMAMLVNVQENYSSNMGKTIRKNKKMYVTDNGIVNAILRNDTMEPTLEGLMVENNCVQAASRVARDHLWQVRFWRDGNKEVDIVLDRQTGLLPIEVKYRNQVTDIQGLLAFMKKYDITSGCVITKDILEKRDNIVYCPYWLID